jgi:hypothetical protein
MPLQPPTTPTTDNPTTDDPTTDLTMSDNSPLRQSIAEDQEVELELACVDLMIKVHKDNHEALWAQIGDFEETNHELGGPEHFRLFQKFYEEFEKAILCTERKVQILFDLDEVTEEFCIDTVENMKSDLSEFCSYQLRTLRCRLQ